jgi:hypothetical protein
MEADLKGSRVTRRDGATLGEGHCPTRSTGEVGQSAGDGIDPQLYAVKLSVGVEICAILAIEEGPI